MDEPEQHPEAKNYKLQTLNVHLPRTNALTRPVEERVQSFAQRYMVISQRQAQQQASRCEQCFTPFCSQGLTEVQMGCPLGNNIPEWLSYCAEGEFEDALHVVLSTNSMPDVSWVCPHKNLCEGSCTMHISGHEAITIGNVESFLIEWGFNNDKIPPITPLYPDLKNKKVAIIGTGYAGYGAAARAAGYGYSVTMFERSDKPGGLAQYGIPSQKLAKFRVDRYFSRLAASGLVDIQTNTSIGSPRLEQELSATGYHYKPFSDLVDEFDAIIIATGAYRPKSARLAGNAADRIIPSIDFLTAHQKQADNARDITGFQGGWYNMKDKDVVIIGGGDTMVDCVTDANAQGAKNIKVLYYRGLENMNAYQTEKDLKNVMEEMGIHDPHDLILDFTLAKEINKREDGKFEITAVKTEYTGELDHWKNPKFREIAGSEHIIITDACMNSVGFNPEDPKTLFDVDGFQLDKNGKLIHHKIPSKDRKGHVKGAGFVGVAHKFGEAANTNQNSAQIYVAGDMAGTGLAAEALNAGQQIMEVVHDGLRKPERLESKWGNDITIPLIAR